MAPENHLPHKDNTSEATTTQPGEASDGPESFYKGLDEEEQQEKSLRSDQDSFLADQNTDLSREREREYKDVEKH